MYPRPESAFQENAGSVPIKLMRAKTDSLLNLSNFSKNKFYQLEVPYLHRTGTCCDIIARLRIRSIFGRILLRIRILQIRILKPDPDPGSYWHLKNQFKHQILFHIKHISSDI